MQAYKVGLSGTVRIIVPISQYEVLIAATPTIGQSFASAHWLERLKKEGEAVEVNLLDEKWVHPHLYKPIKDKVYGQQV